MHRIDGRLLQAICCWTQQETSMGMARRGKSKEMSMIIVRERVVSGEETTTLRTTTSTLCEASAEQDNSLQMDAS